MATSDDVLLAVHDLGGGGGRPVLAAHATGFHGRVWGPLAARLHDLHTVALDFRGHGDSVTPEGYDFDWTRFADDVLDVLDALDWLDGEVAPVGIGHSMGGAALLLAELRRPGTFAGLWVFEPIVFPPEMRSMMHDVENPLSTGARRRRPAFPSRQDAVDTYGSKPPMKVFDTASLVAYVEGGFTVAADGTATLKCRPVDEALVYAQANTCDAFERLGAVTCPTLILRGALVELAPSSLAPNVAAALADGRIEAHDELGHFGPMQGLDAMATSIESFIAGIDHTG